MDSTSLTVVVGLALVVLVVLATSRGGSTRQLERKVDRLEQKLDLTMGQLGIEQPGPQVGTGPNLAIDHEVVALARAGRKIEAIKRYRELTGVGLKEAKDAVERIY